MGTQDAPKKTAALYALDGVLWGTVSEEVRDTPQEIYNYFVSAALSNWWCPVDVRVAVRLGLPFNGITNDWVPSWGLLA